MEQMKRKYSIYKSMKHMERVYETKIRVHETNPTSARNRWNESMKQIQRVHETNTTSVWNKYNECMKQIKRVYEKMRREYETDEKRGKGEEKRQERQRLMERKAAQQNKNTSEELKQGLPA